MPVLRSSLLSKASCELISLNTTVPIIEKASTPCNSFLWYYKNPEVSTMETPAVIGKGKDMFISWEPCSELRD